MGIIKKLNDGEIDIEFLNKFMGGLDNFILKTDPTKMSDRAKKIRSKIKAKLAEAVAA